MRKKSGGLIFPFLWYTRSQNEEDCSGDCMKKSQFTSVIAGIGLTQDKKQTGY